MEARVEQESGGPSSCQAAGDKGSMGVWIHLGVLEEWPPHFTTAAAPWEGDSLTPPPLPPF